MIIKVTKRIKKARQEYARCCIAMQRTEADVQRRVDELGYALDRRAKVRQDYEHACRRLRMAEGD